MRTELCFAQHANGGTEQKTENVVDALGLGL